MGLVENAQPRLSKVVLSNLSDPSQVVVAQYNPTEFTETIIANYARLAPRGLSHEVLQFSNTGNLGFSFELHFNANDSDTGGAANTSARVLENLDNRKILHAFMYPRRAARDLSGVGPPRILFVWPSMVSLTTVIASLNIRHSMFAKTGHSLKYTAAIVLEEIRDYRILSDEVAALGTMRGADAPGK